MAADGATAKYMSIPAQSEWRLTPDASYVHYTPSETISGVELLMREFGGGQLIEEEP